MSIVNVSLRGKSYESSNCSIEDPVVYTLYTLSAVQNSLMLLN